ncbi:MAG TPA: MFS transporter [Acidimicrobiales bacterium]|nr:MFS transporter [Acidimicrobiales bacterium]
MRRFASPSSADRQPLPRGFSTIWTTVALDLVGFGIILPVLPLYARKFHASPATIGVLVASFSVAQLLCSPLWGRLSDRIGRKPVLIVSLVGTAAGSLLTGLAGGLVLLFLGRVVDGASGASVSVAQASVADLAEPSERARLFGLLGAAFGLGFVLGPALGGVCSLVSPRLPFFVAAALAAVNAIVALRRLPETHPVESRRAADTDVTSAPDARAKLRVLSMPGVARLLAVSFLSLVSFSSFEATFSLFGNKRLGLTLSSTYVLFTVIGVLIALDQVVLVPQAVARWGERGALRAGLIINAAGLALLVGVHSLVGLVPSLLLLTAGQGLVTPTLSSAVAGQAPRRDRGRVLGVQQSVGGLARVVGPVLGGLAFGRLGVWVPYGAGAVVLVGAVTLLAVGARPGERVGPVPA